MNHHQRSPRHHPCPPLSTTTSSSTTTTTTTNCPPYPSTEEADRALEDVRSGWLKSVEPSKLAFEVVANLAGDEDDGEEEEDVSSRRYTVV